jgi:hypothetical protein
MEFTTIHAPAREQKNLPATTTHTMTLFMQFGARENPPRLTHFIISLFWRLIVRNFQSAQKALSEKSVIKWKMGELLFMLRRTAVDIFSQRFICGLKHEMFWFGNGGCLAPFVARNMGWIAWRVEEGLPKLGKRTANALFVT